MADTTQQTVAESSAAGPPRRYRGRIAMSVGLVLTGVVLVVTIGVRDPNPPSPAPPPAPPPSSVEPDQAPKSGAQVPRAGLAAPPDRPTVSDQAELDAWAARVAGKTGLSPRLLSAYGRAEMWMNRQKPSCHLSWATLAAIGHLTSDKMRIAPDGAVSGLPPGPPAGPDTDAGELDGDRAADHKLGPLQLPPSAWRKYAERANGDGKTPNPANIDDAAFTTARYLCSGADDLGTPAGWWRAILFYNASVQYGQSAFVAADSYAADSVRP
ncbi:lysozyme family protein [Amycolatopsis jiangsuensis]|uniref:Membrane-bound lytic murein transglycosylase B n=1 Tax=Amycolatopsis jiangsuensis TaxID=1181879 RepID=A0A840J3L1_9PSEU|nr:murein transglycosylase [Amycolatopsis jiangsuensis]MBB4688309.1 membrane-bound lytic murein transglycosylase B [Amycolatopsis jiangsuensis]